MSVSYLKEKAIGCSVWGDRVHCFRAGDYCPKYYRRLLNGSPGDHESHVRCQGTLQFLQEKVSPPEGSRYVWGSAVILKGRIDGDKGIDWQVLNDIAYDGVDLLKVKDILQKHINQGEEGALLDANYFAHCFTVDGFLP